jgi:hypothetical protein
MEQYRSWPFRSAMERNNDDRQANANESGEVFSVPLAGGKANVYEFILGDYQTLEQDEHNE